MNNENIRNIRLRISELDNLETQVENKESEIKGIGIGDIILDTIYELQLNYRKKDAHFPVIISSDHITYECYLNKDILVIRYAGEDLNRSTVRTFEIPMEYVDGEKTLDDWFNNKVKTYEESNELHRKKKEDEEYQTYLELKKKYEN